ncbi:MAG: chromosomal replication initiator protein DnaA [Thermomicrobiales bacterium]
MSVQYGRTLEWTVLRAERPTMVNLDSRLLWQAVLSDVQPAISPSAFEWLRQTQLGPIDAKSHVVVVEVADRVTAETLTRRFGKEIDGALSARLGRSVSAAFQARQHEASHDSTSPDRPRASPPVEVRVPESTRSRADREQPRTAPRQMALEPVRGHGLNAKYIFQTYVVGSANRFAHAASNSVAEHPGGKFNPLFIHGGVGLGKTHLMHAIGHRALELHGSLLVSYVTSEKFTNDLIAAIRQQRTEEFRARYRETDILMIDDIQFIAGKESTQEEFFHTFNALYQSGKQVIISSDKPPKSISALEERLRSRFEGGLIADVQLPDYEMRVAILRMKAEELQTSLPDDVAEYIALKDQSNIRELEGMLNRVMAHAHLTSAPLSLNLVIEALGEGQPRGRRGAPTRDEVVEAVLRHFSITRRELTGRVRTKEIVLPRHITMYLLREQTNASLLDIGSELGGRDHTTVLHGIRQIERAVVRDPSLRSTLMSIREDVAAGH